MKELDLQFRLGAESAQATKKMIDEIHTYNTIEALHREAKKSGKNAIEIETSEGLQTVSLTDAEKMLDAHKSARKTHEERMGTAMHLANSTDKDDQAHRRRLMAVARQWMKQIQ